MHEAPSRYHPAAIVAVLSSRDGFGNRFSFAVGLPTAVGRNRGVPAMNFGVLARDQLRGLLAGQLRPLPGFYREFANGSSVAFVHINKTGGTSIAQALGLPAKCHQTVREMQAKLSESRWSRAFKFAFVRNPWDRAVSLFEYRVQSNQMGLGTSPLPFDQWLRRVFVDRDAHYHDQPKMLQTQCEWMKDDSGQLPLDFIGRFEDFAAQFAVVAQELGFPMELPHLNRTRRGHYQRYYSPESVEIIADYFAEDIGRFGYQY